MFWQLDKDTGMLVGYLGSDPDERKDRNGKRMVVLDVCYNAIRVPCEDGHRHNTVLHMPCVVFGEYTSYARTLSKGDCILAVGERPLEPPRGYTTNPIMVGKRKFGFIGGTGIQRAWTEEQAAYEKNEAVKAVKSAGRGRKKKQKIDISDDKFSEISGEWY